MKKYLETIEDLLALKDTNTKIYADGVNGYYQFRHGVLCYFYNDGSVSIFAEFGIGKGYTERYIFVEEPVKEADENDIGKLCWFWDNENSDKIIGTLIEILTDNPYCFCYRAGCYRHCRRLTPAEVAEITGYKVEEA